MSQYPTRYTPRWFLERFHHTSRYNRKLTVAIALLAFYLCAGTFIFNAIEGWSFLDSFYFSAITLLTIGYGDIVPVTPLGKIFTIIFAFIGASTAIYCVSIIGRKYFEQEEGRLFGVIDKTFEVAKDFSSPNTSFGRGRKTKWEEDAGRKPAPTLRERFPPPKSRV